jgi:hypothetical protein
MSLPRFRTKITGPKQVSVSVTSAPTTKVSAKWQDTAALSVERRKAVTSQGTLIDSRSLTCMRSNALAR